MELLLDGNDWQLIHLMPSEWAWRKVWEENWEPQTNPPAGDWLPGTVPGDAASDALDAGLIPNPYVDLNSRACEWTSERDWVYRKRFTPPDGWHGQTIRLRFDGVDYDCRIYLNGQFLGEHAGMLSPFEYDITSRLRWKQPNTLTVIVQHMPPVEAVQGQIGWTSRARVWKSRFAYNWDWCTRLVPLGIYQSVKLIATGRTWIKDVWVRPVVSAEGARIDAQVRLSFSALAEDASPGEAKLQRRLNLAIEDPSGQRIAEQQALAPFDRLPAEARFSLAIPAPQLWWPNGMGSQPLYQVRAEVIDDDGGVSDSRDVTCGLRSIRAVANDGAPAGALPYTLEVNGRRMYVKGWNWAPIDNLYGRPQARRYERWLTLARHAHCNLLRVWGGGLLEREHFYNLCDRFGILVWQEFMQSSSGVDNRPPEDDAYLDTIEALARQIVPQKRNHPSLAIWCGGNELISDDWVPLSDSHPALARLKSVAHELDPDRIWLPTSPSGPAVSADPKLKGTGAMHDVHGPWQYQGPEAQYQLFNNIDALYHSEYGAEGATNLYTLQQYCSPRYQFPPDATNPVWLHHGSWWLHREKLEALFGPLDSIEAFIPPSQWMQAEGLRYATESNRRRKWQCSGSSPWQFNEAFPNFACTNAIDFAGLPKPAYWWMRRAYEPAHISLKYERLTWQPGQPWQAEVWINNSLAASPGCRWTADIMTLGGERLAAAGGQVDLPDNAALAVDQISLQLPADPGIWLVTLALAAPDGRPLSRNDYLFSSHGQHPLRPLLDAPQAQLRARLKAGEIDIANTGTTPALLVQIEPAAGEWIMAADSYFCLAPGESRRIGVSGQGRVTVKAWNAAARRIAL